MISLGVVFVRFYEQLRFEVSEERRRNVPDPMPSSST